MGDEDDGEVKRGFDFVIEIRHADMEQSMQVGARTETLARARRRERIPLC